MQTIKYSVSENTVQWGPKAGQKRYTANLQTAGTVTLDDFAGHMADHDCKYNKGDIYSVLTQAATCLREMLVGGYKVCLGDLGTISPKIGQQAATKREDFSSSNITRLYAKITIGKALRDMRQDATFEQVPILANRSLLLAAEREGATSVDLTRPTNGGSNGSSGSSGGASPNPSSGGENGGDSGTTTVAAPTISGTTPFSDTTSMTISGPTGASIYYTTDGSTPTSASTQYSSAVTLSATTTVKAIAIKDGVSSSVTTKTFTKSEGGGGDDSPDGVE